VITPVFICLYVHLYVCMCIKVCKHIDIPIYIHVCIYVYMCIRAVTVAAHQVAEGLDDWIVY